MELLLEYGLFLAKTLTLVAAVLIIAGFIITMAGKNRGEGREQLVVKKLNDRYRNMERTLRHALMSRKQARSELKKEKKGLKLSLTSRLERKRVYVMNFPGDIRASRTDNLREEITAVLTLARPEQDQVVVRVESGGGMVHSYGLAASQLARLREHGIPLTVTVDKVAASGGYLMAAVANHVLAAPFAIVGSIGVVAQIPNIHRLLRKHDVDVELHTAGQFKRTLTMLGENTEEGRQKFREELEHTHALFKDYVSRYRPGLDLDKVATGEHWYGEQALALNLVDKIGTSDDLLMELTRDADVYEVDFKKKKPMGKRLSVAIENALSNGLRNL